METSSVNVWCWLSPYDVPDRYIVLIFEMIPGCYIGLRQDGSVVSSTDPSLEVELGCAKKPCRSAHDGWRRLI